MGIAAALTLILVLALLLLALCRSQPAFPAGGMVGQPEPVSKFHDPTGQNWRNRVIGDCPTCKGKGKKGGFDYWCFRSITGVTCTDCHGSGDETKWVCDPVQQRPVQVAQP